MAVSALEISALEGSPVEMIHIGDEELHYLHYNDWDEEEEVDEEEFEQYRNIPIWRSFGMDSKIGDGSLHDDLPRFKLTPEEEEVVVYDGEDDPKYVNMIKKSVMVELQDSKRFSQSILLIWLEKMWKVPRKHLSVRERGDKSFLILFEDREEMEFVLERTPWVINGSFLMLEPSHKDVWPEHFRVKRAPVWVRMSGLPKGFSSSHSIVRLGTLAGDVRLIDSQEESEYTSMRTIIRPDEPLVAGVYVFEEEDESVNKHWVEFRYEGVLVLCRNCGVIGHGNRECRLSYAEVNALIESKVTEIQARLKRVMPFVHDFRVLARFHGSSRLYEIEIVTDEQDQTSQEKNCKVTEEVSS